MAKRRIKLNEDDLKSFLGTALSSAGYMDEGDEILGFEYLTRKIKRGGDYYKDGIDDPSYPGEVEEVKFIKILVEKGRKKGDDNGSDADA